MMFLPCNSSHSHTTFLRLELQPFKTKGSELTYKTKPIFMPDSFHPSHFINKESEMEESRMTPFIHWQSYILSLVYTRRYATCRQYSFKQDGGLPSGTYRRVGSQMRGCVIIIQYDKCHEGGKGRMLLEDMAVTTNLLLMRFRGILLEEEPSMLVMKNEQTLAQQRVKLKDKNQPVQTKR